MLTGDSNGILLVIDSAYELARVDKTPTTLVPNFNTLRTAGISKIPKYKPIVLKQYQGH